MTTSTALARAVLAALVESDAALACWWGTRTDDERALVEARCEAAVEQTSRP